MALCANSVLTVWILGPWRLSSKGRFCGLGDLGADINCENVGPLLLFSRLLGFCDLTFVSGFQSLNSSYCEIQWQFV